jgi:hypothetical protein
MAYMDRLLTDEVQENETQLESIKAKILDLVDIYYEALDSPNSENKVIFIPELIWFVVPVGKNIGYDSLHNF